MVLLDDFVGVGLFVSLCCLWLLIGLLLVVLVFVVCFRLWGCLCWVLLFG